MEAHSIYRTAQTTLPTGHGVFQLIVYGAPDGAEHLALTVGAVAGAAPVLTRLHSECLTGDVFGSARCDCGEQLHASLARLQREGRGVLLYLRQEGRGIGLTNKIRAYTLQDQGLDTVDANLALGLPADKRDYRIAAEMLRDLGIRSVRLVTNNPAKIEGLRRHGIEVAERVAIETPAKPSNVRYLRAKQLKMGHLLGSMPAASAADG
jgi:GTP cyclohydrolase II